MPGHGHVPRSCLLTVNDTLRQEAFSARLAGWIISDHLEVKYDLDTQAAEVAMLLGLNMVRCADCRYNIQDHSL